MNTAAVRCYSGSDEPVIYHRLSPVLTTHNAGESNYDRYNTGGGIVFPRLQITPAVDFQLWNTHEPLLHTPGPTIVPALSPASSPTVGESKDIAVYPNPGRNEQWFVLPEAMSGRVTIDIYNMKNERISSLEAQLEKGCRIKWPCRDVAPGIYIARIKNNEQLIKVLKLAVV